MKKKSKTIIFFGTEDFSLITLKALVEADFNIGAVVTKPDARRGRGTKKSQPAVKIYANEHNIQVWQPQNLKDIVDDIKKIGKPVGILVSYGKIIPQSIIDLFTPGIINIHPSLLPKYRGPTPIESAIKNGDKETGISIIQLNARMDAGPIYRQVKHALNGKETKLDLYNTLGKIGANEIINTLPGILNESILPKDQDESKASYCSLLSKDDSLIQPHQMIAQQIERVIRAHLDYPKTKLPFLQNNLIVTRSHIAKEPSESTIACKDDTLLSIDEIIAPSGKHMKIKDYLNGIRNKRTINN